MIESLMKKAEKPLEYPIIGMIIFYVACGVGILASNKKSGALSQFHRTGLEAETVSWLFFIAFITGANLLVYAKSSRTKLMTVLPFIVYFLFSVGSSIESGNIMDTVLALGGLYAVSAIIYDWNKIKK